MSEEEARLRRGARRWHLTIIPPLPARGERVGPEAKAQSERLRAEETARRKAETEQIARAKLVDPETYVDMWRYLQEPAPKVERLASWLKRIGGLRDDGGEVKAMLGAANMRPGLISKQGMSLDDAAHAAWEEGFLSTPERPEINDLLDALGEDLNGRIVARADDAGRLADLEDRAHIAEQLSSAGFTGDMTEGEVRAHARSIADEVAARAAEEAQADGVVTAAGDTGEGAGVRGSSEAAQSADGTLDDPFDAALSGLDRARRAVDFQIKTGRAATCADAATRVSPHVLPTSQR